MTATSRCILLINHEYPPLSGSGGQATYHIAQEMAALGHHPIVLTAAWNDLPRISNENGVTVHRISALRRSAEDSVFEMFAFAVSALIAAPGVVRQWRPDAAIVFFGLPNGPVGWYLKRRYKVPYVIALQGGDVPGFGSNAYAEWHRSLGGLLRRLWADANAVIANSGSLAAFARRSAPDQAINVIPAGADVTGITSKTIYATRGGGLRLLFVGRLVRERGLDVLIKALATLPMDLPWRLVLAGDGPEWTNLAGLAARHNIAERIEVSGWVKREDLPGIYRDADVFVLPSRIDGTPENALLEAMAAGLPVIGTRVASTQEAVVEGSTGFLADPEEVEGLAKAVTALANDTGLRAAMGQAGRTRAELRFGWPAIANVWLETTARIVTPNRP